MATSPSFSILCYSADASTVDAGTHRCRTIQCLIFQQLNVYIFYTLACVSFSLSQEITIYGRVIDAATRLPVSQAVIQLREMGKTTISTETGTFQFTVPDADSYTISLHHISYSDTQFTIKNVNAQDTAEFVLLPSVVQSPGLIVYSTKLSLKGEESAFPLDVLYQNELVRHSPTTISDVLKNSPGLWVVRDGSWETAISIRGMSRSNIVMLIDNTRIETANDIAGALSLFNIHDLERVETIRSSGAAVCGTGALGGVVHLMTKRPSFSDEFHLHGEITSEFSNINSCASQHAAFEGSSERFAMRVSGGFRNAGNTGTPAGFIPNSQFTDFNFNGSMGLKTTDTQTLLLSYQRSQGENIGISGGSPIAASAHATYTMIRRELFGAEYSIPNISALFSSLMIRLSQQNIYRNVEIIQTPVLTLTPHAVHSTLSGQAESKMLVAPNNMLTLGIEIWRRTLLSQREKINRSNNTIIGERPIPRSQFQSAGFYGQDEWTIQPEKMTMFIGMRYDWIDIHNDETDNPEYSITNGILNSTPAGQKILWKSGTIQNGSWSANTGIQYALSRSLDVTFLASTAFRSPSLEERYQYLTLGDGVHIGNPDLQPEQSKSFNAGIRWHSDRSYFRADLFLNELTNLVSDVPGIFEGSAAYIKKNINRARLYGYEIVGEQSLSKLASVNYSLSYVRGTAVTSRTHLPSIPPLHGSIMLNAHHERAGSLSLITTFSASQKFIANGEQETGGYVIYDLDAVTIPLAFDRFSFTVRSGIQNIFNKGYRNHLSTIRGTMNFESGRNFFASLLITT